MQRFIIIRCLYALLVLFIVSIIVFALARTSGSPVGRLSAFRRRPRSGKGPGTFPGFGPADTGSIPEICLERVAGRLWTVNQLGGSDRHRAGRSALPRNNAVGRHCHGNQSPYRDSHRGSFGGKEGFHLRLHRKSYCPGGPVPAALLAGHCLDFHFCRLLGRVPHSGPGRRQEPDSARNYLGLVPGSGHDAPGSFRHAGSAGLGVHQAGPNQGPPGVEGSLEARPEERRHSAPDLLWALWRAS